MDRVTEDRFVSDDKAATAVEDDKPAEAAEAPKKTNRLKTLFGTFAGLLSGAFMMYVSPLLTKVVQPAKPVANFGVDHNGLSVTFSNHSTGGSEGWMDFGDGTPLEPISPKQTTITHTYASPESYYAKLTWRNLFGDENERSVKIELESPKSDPPTILSLDATPITPSPFAPATFRVTSKTQNAKLCVWDFGDDRHLEFSMVSPENQDRLVTFKKAGGYMVKMAAVNGEQGVEKSTIVYVDEPPPGAVAAIVTVTDQATRLERIETPVPVSVSIPPHNNDDIYRFDRQVPAKQGFQITDARLETISDHGTRGVEVKIAPDHQSVHVTGELVKEGGLLHRNAAPPSLVVRVILTQQRQVPDARPPVPVTGTLSAPGALLLGLPPLPDTWIDPQRQLQLELRDGDRVVWSGAQLPHGVPMTLNNKPYALTAAPLGNQVRVELADVKPPAAAPAPRAPPPVNH
jgi:PKD repeat protein